MRTGVVGALAAVAVLATTACEPCTGITGCTEPRVEVHGVVVEAQSGLPVEGARVSYTFRYGPGLGPQTTPPQLEAVTDAEGQYTLAAEADVAGELTGRLTVARGDAFLPAIIDGVVVLVSSRDRVQQFDTIRLPRRPFVRGRGVVIDRAGNPVPGQQVRFDIALGPRLVSGSSSITAVTDETGTYEIFAHTREYGSLVGTLSFPVPPPTPLSSIGGVVLNTSDRGDFVEVLDTTVIVRPGYVRVEGLVVDDATGAGVAGVRVSFRPRTAPPLLPEEPSAVTDADGRYTITGNAYEVAWMVGSLVAEPPAPYATVTLPETGIGANGDPGAVTNAPTIRLVRSQAGSGSP